MNSGKNGVVTMESKSAEISPTVFKLDLHHVLPRIDDICKELGVNKTTEGKREAFNKTTDSKREALKMFLSRQDFAFNAQNIHTPYNLCREQISKLEEYTSIVDKDILVYNIEYIEILLYDFGVKRENITFITDCVEKAALILYHSRYVGVNVQLGNFSAEGIKNMFSNCAKHFNLVCGNPPYQAEKKRKVKNSVGQCGTTLWDPFVSLSLRLVKENGYVTLIHPSGWRKPDNYLWPIMKQKQFLYLEMYSYKGGEKVFGKGTRFDWYVLQNSPVTRSTTIQDQDGVVSKIDMNSTSFIPNALLEEVSKLVAKPGEERVEILNSWTLYETRAKWMKKEQDEEHSYPCIYSINVENVPTCYYSSRRDGHFGIPKVVWGSGNGGFVVDENGKYGLTQYARAIVDSKENLYKIVTALHSEKFKKIALAISTSTNELDKSALSLFRKDFWKEFI